MHQSGRALFPAKRTSSAASPVGFAKGFRNGRALCRTASDCARRGVLSHVPGRSDQEPFREGVVEGRCPARIVRACRGQWMRGRELVPVREGVRKQFQFGVRGGFLRGQDVVRPVGRFPVLVFAGVAAP